MTNIKYSFAQWCKDNGHEDWLKLWDYERNGIDPDEVAFRSNKKFFFKCSRGLHESESAVLNNVAKRKTPLYCHKCNSFGQYLLDNFGEDSITTYWSDKNDISPFDIARASNKSIWIKCTDAMHPDYVTKAKDFLSGNRCPVCSSKKLLVGVNDLATTRPDLVKYFINPEDAKAVFANSNKSMDFKCPDCGYIKSSTPNDLSSRRFSCKKCGDGNSYPNKYMREFLLQLSDIYQIEIIPEHIFKWSQNISDGINWRVYDFVINTENPLIIEVHGDQHYKYGFGNFSGAKNLQEEQENDAFKKDLAIRNGVLEDHYIVIDARKSESSWIKNSIMNSNLRNIYHFEEADIDWAKCNEVACKNAIRTVCDMYMSGITSVMELSKKAGYCKKTIHKYLKTGKENGWCDYDESYRYCSLMRPIRCIENGYVFASMSKCAELSEEIFGKKLFASGISENVLGKTSCCGGFHFAEITKEYFIQTKNESPNIVFGFFH